MARPLRSSAAKMLVGFLLVLFMWSDTAATAPSPTSAPSSATSGGPAATHTVNAGSDGFSFIPNTIQANVGDTILFIFYPQNHSVARAEFGYPCIPYENTGQGKVGFWSGFEPVDKVTENSPKYALLINSTEPIFFYCSADGACVPNGMIGVINPNATQTLDAQFAYQKKATIQLSPGQPIPPESTPSATAAPSGGSSSGLGAGAIAGIVVGVVVVIGLAGLAFYLCGRNRSLASVIRYSQPPSRPDPRNVPHLPHTPSPAHTPYSPEFSPKPGYSPSSRPGNLHPHDSWATQPAMRPISPEMIAQGGAMSPHSFNSGFSHQGYNAVDNPGNMALGYHAQPSPTHVGYGGVQYAQVPQSHEMAHESSPGMPSPGFPSHHNSLIPPAPQPQPPPEAEVHELDARSSVPDPPGAAPPQYTTRSFSFSAGGDAPPGVEKVLRD